MENKDMATIPYFAFEAVVHRDLKIIKWLIIVCVILASLFFASNALWVYYFNQYDFESEEITLDGSGDGNANYINGNGNGGITYGKDYDQTQETDQAQEIDQ